VRRVLAVLAAVGMVVAAVMLRQAVDDDDGGGSSDGGDGDLVVLCSTDLRDVCLELGDSVEVLTADPATTAVELAEGTLDAEIDAWITSTAWLEVTESRAPAALGDTRAIASSPATMATAPDRFEAISDLCAGEDIWQCLGGHAGTDWSELGDGSNAEWRELKVGLTDPDVALGLPVLASAAAGFFGTTDFAVNDPQYPEFEAWLSNLAGPSASGDANPANTLATRPGTYSAAGSVGAVADGLDSRGVETIGPVVPVAATIAIVELAGGDGLPGTDDVRDALEEAGWARANEDDLSPTLKPGVMAALHSLWRAVTT
jgi:hypothetical protein